LQALFLYYLQTWSNPQDKSEDSLNLLPPDLYSRFDREFEYDVSVNQVVNSIMKNQWYGQSTLQNFLRSQLKLGMHQMLTQYFSQFSPESKLSFSNAKYVGFEELLAMIFEKENNKVTEEMIISICSDYSSQRAFANLLIHAPLSTIDSNSTFMHIRQAVKTALYHQLLIDENGVFCEEKICTSTIEELEDLIIAVQEEAYCILSDTDSEFSIKILEHFEEVILGRLKSIHNQGQELVLEDDHVDQQLATLCRQTAKRFGLEIDVVFYQANDGNNAFTYQGSNKFHANRLGILKNYERACSIQASEDIFNGKLAEQIYNFSLTMETIVHELTHMQEDKGCVTHDKKFKKRLAKNLESLFIFCDSKEELPF
jgi:hypothetical protein